MAQGFSILDNLNKSTKDSILEDKASAKSRTKDLDIRLLYRNESNFYSKRDIRELADKIAAVGLLQPLIVVYDPNEKGEYRIIDGEQRHLALLLIREDGNQGFNIVSCTVRPKVTKEEELIELIFANAYRDKTIKDTLTEARVLKETLQEMKAKGIKLKGQDLSRGRLRDTIAQIMDKSPTTIAEIEKINKSLIPEFKKETEEDKIPFSTAYHLAGLSQERQQEAYKQYLETGSISLKEAKQLKQQEKNPEGQQEEQTKDPEEPVKAESKDNKDDDTEDPAEDNTERQQDFDPSPDYIDTKCYSCKHWDDCDKKDPTVNYCNEFVDRNKKDTKSDRQQEQDLNGYKEVNYQDLEEPENPVPAVPKIHYLKLSTKYFDDVAAGIKTFELRKNDRDYKVGERLHLEDYADGHNTGRHIEADITYMLEEYTGITDGYCILGIKVTKVNGERNQEN